MFDKSEILSGSTSASFIILDFGTFQFEEHHAEEDRITVSLGSTRGDCINLTKEEWEIYKNNYWSKDPVIRAMTIEVLKNKKNI